MTNGKTIPKFGVVAILDALGISNLRMDETLNFIESRDRIINDPLVAELVHINAPRFDENLSKPDIFTFGDTMIFAWELKIPDYPHEGILYVSDWLRPIMFTSLYFGKTQLFLRGALSVGQYVVSGNSILGPAVADAAAWYDAANWMGVIATPSVGPLIDTIYSFKGAHGVSSGIVPRYMRYNVPLKKQYAQAHGRDTLDAWAIAWPHEFYESDKDLEKAIATFYMCFQITNNNGNKIRIPFGTESKYKNTIEFFNAFEKWRTDNDAYDALICYMGHLNKKRNPSEK